MLQFSGIPLGALYPPQSCLLVRIVCALGRVKRKLFIIIFFYQNGCLTEEVGFSNACCLYRQGNLLEQHFNPREIFMPVLTECQL